MDFDSTARAAARPWMIRAAWLALALSLALVLAACERRNPIAKAFPQDVPPGAVCDVDGMVLAGHPGPKGQWVQADGKVAWFCDLKEVLAALHDPAREGKGRWFVQAFDGRPWGSYGDAWVAAEEALYVLDSAAEGAMGPTPVTFRDRGAAEAFRSAKGGRVVGFADLTADTVEQYLAGVRTKFRGAKGSTPGMHEGMGMGNDRTNGPRLPAGHPPIMGGQRPMPGMPRTPAPLSGEQVPLPEGHPPVPGEFPALPKGHPQVPADGGDTGPAPMRPGGPDH